MRPLATLILGKFAVSVQDRKSLSLAFGSATAMRAQFVVGYFAGERSVPNFDPTHSVVALRWVHGRRKSLGPGIAYGVNRSGTVVGNDSRELDDLGRPTLWRGDHRFALSSESGSAYAIADDGIVVGATGNSAFIARSVDKRSTFNVTPLDRRVRGTGWHITGAYAIDAKGRILAAGYRTNGTLQVLLLDPARIDRGAHKRIWARDRHPTPKALETQNKRRRASETFDARHVRIGRLGDGCACGPRISVAAATGVRSMTTYDRASTRGRMRSE